MITGWGKYRNPEYPALLIWPTADNLYLCVEFHVALISGSAFSSPGNGSTSESTLHGLGQGFDWHTGGN
jgi:hypothetical protein